MISHLQTIAIVLEHGQKTNSYKCALTLALSELPDSVNDQSPVVTADWLAERFFHYYWPLATQFRIRQSTDPSKEPIAASASRDLATRLALDPGTPIVDVRRHHRDDYENVLRRLARQGGCLDEVLPRYHSVKGNIVRKPLFEVQGRNISLMPGVAGLLKANRRIVRQCALGAWVRFTESISATPKLYAKLSGARPNRRALGSYRTLLTETFGGECFYCGATAPEMHVDHFLPWSFVLEDKLWNLVLACGGSDGCNHQKSDRIPRREQVRWLINRNSLILDGNFGADIRGHKDFKEWHAGDLPRHIEQLAITALAEGFSQWREFSHK